MNKIFESKNIYLKIQNQYLKWKFKDDNKSIKEFL